MERVRSAFRPEFINRLDEILLFRRLSRDHMSGIVDIQLSRLQNLLKDRQVTLTVETDAREILAERGYDPVYGARPLKRVIQRDIQNALSEMILRGEVPDQSKVRVDVKDGDLHFVVETKSSSD